MKKIINNPILILILRLIVGYVFITFGIGKIANPEKFVGEIANYNLLPEIFLNIFALILPWLEVITGILLTLGMRIRANAVISAGLMIVFILAVVWAISMGLDINCGCSSTNPQKIGFPKLLENLGLLLSSVIIYFSSNNKFSLESFIEK
jgi:uncharacterized membrane protein YphA (DoxX/SURF4 family)